MSNQRTPPHDIDVEDALIGAMLLSRNAVDAASEHVTANAFYKPANAHIFDAILGLTSSGQPSDPVTVADELRRHNLLDAAGGPNALLDLVARTPGTTSAARHAQSVADYHTQRELIAVGGEIVEKGYEPTTDIQATLDEAEALMFRLGNHRDSSTIASVPELLDETLDILEARAQGPTGVTGTPTGYLDVDDLLGGLHPNALYVVGARPGMGKTSFAMGIASHAAIDQQLPCLFVSLEMSKTELTQRLLCSEARVDSTKVRTGRLADDDWARIAAASPKFGSARLWIDDNPQATIMDIRAKARRLIQREGPLGVIVVDYLQLMHGRGNAENRQNEVAEISRGLKVLAREMECPVVALAQLNRGLEQRLDKRPVLSDLRDSGCLSAGTRLLRADTNSEVTLGELVESGATDVPVWALGDDWKIHPATLSHAFPSGSKEVFKMTFASGREVEATANHKFRTIDGWKALEQLEVGARLAVPRYVPAPTDPKPMDPDRLTLLAFLLGDGTVLPKQPIHITDNDPEKLDMAEGAASRAFGIVPRRVAQGTWWHSYLPAKAARNPISQWWDQLGLTGCRSHEKFIPDEVHQLPTDQVRDFVRCLWATDGTIFERSGPGPAVAISYSTSSRRLVDGLQLLLLRLGIHARIKAVAPKSATHRTNYHLDVYGAEMQRTFLDQVGGLGRSAASAAACARRLDGMKANPNVDTVPWGVRPKIISALAHAGMSQRDLAAATGDCYNGSYFLGSPDRQRSSSRSRLAGMAEALGSTELAEIAASDVLWDSLVAVESLGEQPVFDATVPGPHNFIANNVVAHNSLEQDADVVMFLYRDEQYNPDSPDRGCAEVLVAKHRAGPTGMVRLAFLAQYTKFANMARS